MNESRTCASERTKLTQRRSRPVRDPHKERLSREAWALEVVKGMRKSPSAPEPPPEPLLPIYKPVPDAPGWVYFAYCAGRIKIGYSTSLDSRLAAYPTHAPHRFVLLLAIGGSEADEAAYHEEFADDLAQGREWFRLSHGLREFIECQTMNPTLLFEAEHDYHAAAQVDLAWITKFFEEMKEIENEQAAV